MIKKPVLLFLALLLPVSIFLFLHFFGKNEFEIPVYYQEDEGELPPDCGIDYSYPYRIDDNQSLIHGNSLVFFASGLSSDEIKDAQFQLGRIKAEFITNAPELIFVISSSDTLIRTHLPGATILSLQDYDQIQRCVFLSKGNRIVLVDSLRHIRGLYTDARLKEVDRIILELKILYKEY